MKTKRCSSCKKWLTLNNFTKNKSKKDGIGTECRQCRHNYEIYRRDPFRSWTVNTRTHHKQKGIEVNISNDELYEMAIKAAKCPICGVELAFIKKDRNGRTSKNSPSWDRIDNGNEMNSKNTWVICNRCNMAKGDIPLKQWVEYCRMVVEKFGDKL